MQIEAYTQHWQSAVSNLADKVLGDRYFVTPTQIGQEPDSCLFVCVTKEDELAGFIKGKVLPENGLQEYAENKLENVPADIGKADSRGALGVLETIIVAPEHRKQGVATKLLQVAHDAVVGLGGDVLIVSFKRGHHSPNVDRLMSQLGFEFWVSVESFWKNRCDAGDFKCVDRTDHCVCEGLFYHKPVFA